MRRRTFLGTLAAATTCGAAPPPLRLGIAVLVNDETTWYPSNHAAYALAREAKALGEIRKVVAHDGLRGPGEIGVQPEFLAWLTDPDRNGAGGPLRLRLLRRQPDDLADGRRVSHRRDRRDP